MDLTSVLNGQYTIGVLVKNPNVSLSIKVIFGILHLPCQPLSYLYFAALQRRVVRCEIGRNLTLDPSKCELDAKPIDRQECFNEKCVGKWKVGAWSEVNSIGCIFIYSIIDISRFHSKSLMAQVLFELDSKKRSNFVV